MYYNLYSKIIIINHQIIENYQNEIINEEKHLKKNRKKRIWSMLHQSHNKKNREINDFYSIKSTNSLGASYPPSPDALHFHSNPTEHNPFASSPPYLPFTTTLHINPYRAGGVVECATLAQLKNKHSHTKR